MSPAPRELTLLWEHRVSFNGTKLVQQIRGSPRGLGAWSGEEAAIREGEGDPVGGGGCRAAAPRASLLLKRIL